MTSAGLDLPPFTVPTVTLMAGPEETREAVKVVPFLWYLWQKKSSLQDQEHKQEYIDDASSISEVDLLTDTLKDIGDELDKQGDERTSSAQSSASSASSTSSSSSISSSCTTTITKTWESVVCTVTATPSANKKRQDQTCTTQVYSTVTGCSVIGSTTTSTTTITPGTTPIPQCNFESCGTGSTCPNKRPRSQRMGWPRELRRKQSGFHGGRAVSKRGAWVSHMWEVPSFTSASGNPTPPTDLQQLDIFRQQVLMALHSGSEIRPQVMINSYRVNYMNDDADPHVFIFVPYARAPSGTPNYGKEFPVGLQEAFGQDDGLPSKNQQIENEVLMIRTEERSSCNTSQPKAARKRLPGIHQAEWVSSANPVASNPQGAVQGRQDSTSSPIVCPLPSPAPFNHVALSYRELNYRDHAHRDLHRELNYRYHAHRNLHHHYNGAHTNTNNLCNSEADFPGHGDVSPGAQDNFAVHFSGLDGPGGSEYMSSTTPTFEMKIADKHGISYDYSVGWVPGCVTTVDEQSFRYPLAVGDLNVVVGDPSKVTAYWLLRVVFTDCNNRGVGGKRQAGCLEYTFTGAK
ncbi:hypothetical protein F4801DRAFT_594424 [Xylaria longipes]|nr:hypothetical protein F4801DRAFT_594424 [Xylaria longipes]